MKKILKIVLIVLGVLLLIGLIAPFLFKGKLIAIAKEEINKSLNAKADFKDLNISFFRHFPRVSAGLEQLQIIGVGEFETDTLISAREIDVALDLWSVIKGKNIKVHSVTLDNPRIHAIVTREGRANWDIMKPDTAATETPESEQSFNMQLRKYAVKNGYLKYDDDTADMHAEIINLDHSGSGDFTADIFTLATKTKADAVNFSYEGIPYLISAATDIDTDLEINNKENKYSFKTDNIQVNNLKLSTEGFFQFVNDSTYNMDIKFNAPSTDFKDILSLIPSIYKKDFDKIKTEGSALFNGFVKGIYDSSHIPAYSINMDIKDGFFKYPDLPQPVKNINLTIKVSNPDGIPDNTVVDIPKGHLEMSNEPFDFRLLLKKPVTDMYIDLAAKGSLDLSKLSQFVKLDPETRLGGLIKADITAKGNAIVVTQQKPGPFTASGFVDINNLSYSSADFPQPVKNTHLKIDIQNPDGIADHTVVSIPSGHIEVGTEALDFNLLIKTPASDLFFDGGAKGKFNLANIAQFVTLEPGTQLSGLLSADLSFRGNKSAIDKEQYEKITTAGTLSLADLEYVSKDYPDGIKIGRLVSEFNPKNITVRELAGKYKGTNFTANGTINNAIRYALKDNEPLDGSLTVKADQVNLNELIGAPATEDSSTADSKPFEVPRNIDFTINAAVGDLKYDNIQIKNLTGRLQLKDEQVQLNNVKGDALGGTMTVGGSYSTRSSKDHPAIALEYDVQNVDIQQTFRAFNTVQKLMPVAQFISGRINSKLSLNGNLGASMMPDLSTLSGKGNLLILDGVLNEFGPTNTLASALNIKELQKFSLKDIKALFEFSAGKVLVKPFTVKIKDIEMEVGGVHGLDQSIDYIINMKVPRQLLGSQANNLVNNLAAQATAKGIPVKLSDVINLKVNMGGTIKNPQVNLNMKEAGASMEEELKQQAEEFARAKIDSTKKIVSDTLKSLKEEAIKTAKDEILKQLGGKKDSTASEPASDPKKRLEEAGKNVLKNILKKNTNDTSKQQ